MKKNVVDYVISLCYLAELKRTDLISDEEYDSLKKTLSIKYGI